MRYLEFVSRKPYPLNIEMIKENVSTALNKIGLNNKDLQVCDSSIKEEVLEYLKEEKCTSYPLYTLLKDNFDDVLVFTFNKDFYNKVKFDVNALSERIKNAKQDNGNSFIRSRGLIAELIFQAMLGLSCMNVMPFSSDYYAYTVSDCSNINGLNEIKSCRYNNYHLLSSSDLKRDQVLSFSMYQNEVDASFSVFKDGYIGLYFYVGVLMQEDSEYTKNTLEKGFVLENPNKSKLTDNSYNHLVGLFDYFQNYSKNMCSNIHLLNLISGNEKYGAKIIRFLEGILIDKLHSVVKENPDVFKGLSSITNLYRNRSFEGKIKDNTPFKEEFGDWSLDKTPDVVICFPYREKSADIKGDIYTRHSFILANLDKKIIQKYDSGNIYGLNLDKFIEKYNLENAVIIGNGFSSFMKKYQKSCSNKTKKEYTFYYIETQSIAHILNKEYANDYLGKMYKKLDSDYLCYTETNLYKIVNSIIENYNNNPPASDKFSNVNPYTYLSSELKTYFKNVYEKCNKIESVKDRKRAYWYITIPVTIETILGLYCLNLGKLGFRNYLKDVNYNFPDAVLGKDGIYSVAELIYQFLGTGKTINLNLDYFNEGLECDNVFSVRTENNIESNLEENSEDYGKDANDFFDSWIEEDSEMSYFDEISNMSDLENQLKGQNIESMKNIGFENSKMSFDFVLTRLKEVIGEDTIVGSSVLKGICENPKAYLAIFIDLMYQMEIISKKDMEMAVLRQKFAIMIGKGFKDLRSEFIENL